jgi:hypothetical protein
LNEVRRARQSCFSLYTRRQSCRMAVTTPIKGLTSSRPDACARRKRGFAALRKWGVVVALAWYGSMAIAQEEGASRRLNEARSTRRVTASATIFWSDVPLRDAVARLEKLFGETIFLDRRVDPTARLHLNIRAGSLEQVIEAIDVKPKLRACRMWGRAIRRSGLRRWRRCEARRWRGCHRGSVVR